MAVKNKTAIFAYKTKKGALHRVPALLKLIILIPFSIFCVSLPLPGLGIGIGILFIIGFACGFSLFEQFHQLRPALFYGILMYILSMISKAFETGFSHTVSDFLLIIIVPNSEFLFIFLRLMIIIQLSALFFRTTSNLEIRNSLATVETAIGNCISRSSLFHKHRSAELKISIGIALFAGFIPEIFQTWAQLDKAWTARCGKKGLHKIKQLIIILITLSFEKAWRKALCMANRSIWK